MESSIYTLRNLFDQLGLPSDTRDNENFIEQHKPVSSTSPLYELEFFTPSQQNFLKEATEQGANWTEITDTLDTLLRKPSDIRPS